ncbi:MAG: Wzz/FepE/Etk N-terminal domain-containing protein [Gammaproteobacteria bacterium]|nr:Wzz/FepE/Etk N-terminal domain-containing protein [Gammaproteobacteria bacterium]
MRETILQAITILRDIWRYRWQAMLVAWIACTIGWIVVFKLPDQYESKARIYIDSDSILKPLLRGISVESTDFREQLGLMTNKLLSRSNLEKVITMVDLDINARTTEEREALIINLGKNIKLSAVRTQQSEGRREPPNLYEITSRGSNAKQVKDIVQALLTIFLETAIGETRQDTGVAQKFLEAQITEYEAKLAAAENRLMEFKRNNMGVLPSQDVGIFQRLQMAREQLNQVELELLEATNRRDEIQRQLNSVNKSEPVALPPGVVQQPSPLESRIITLQQRLDELQLKYTQEHPTVIETKQMLAMLEAQQEEQKKAAASGEGDMSATNPVYQQLKLSLGEVDAQIAGMRVRRDAYQTRLSKLNEDLKILPEVEAELQRLDRDYEINKQQYNELVARRESAKLAGHVEQSGEKVKFKVIEPPRVPIAPIGPNRPLLSAGVLVFGIGLGIGLAFLLSQIRPVFHDRRSIQEGLELPVFGVISRVWTPQVLWKRKVQFSAFIVSGVLLAAVFGGVVYLNFKGIDATQLI